MNTNQKLTALRAEMLEHGINAYIVLSEDAHQSEYAATHWRSREWLTGFDGSAGTAVVTQKNAALWVDGRYYIQAARQIEGSGFQLIRAGMDEIEICDWIVKMLAEELQKASFDEGTIVVIDGRTLSVSEHEKYQTAFIPYGIRLRTSEDLIGDIWKERPSLPLDMIFEHDVKFAGKTRVEKLSELRRLMCKKGTEGYLISSLDDVAWLYNLRGSDIEFLPVFYAHAFVGMSCAYLFVDEAKLDDKLRAALSSDGITLRPYGAITDFLWNYNEPAAIFIDPDRISVHLEEQI